MPRESNKHEKQRHYQWRKLRRGGWRQHIVAHRNGIGIFSTCASICGISA